MGIALEKRQLIGFAGLASHEEAIIDMAQRVYASRLNMARAIADLSLANIIFADPVTADGMASLHRSDAYVIAVQSRRDSPMVSADATLHRPLSPRAVLDLLNGIDAEQPFSGAHPGDRVSRELPGLFRDAMTRTQQKNPWLVRKSGIPVLMLDPGRDRMGGDFSLLSANSFLSGDHYTTEMVFPQDAARMTGMEVEIPLYQCLWRLSHDLGGRRRLFGDENGAMLRFKCWPNLSEAGISRGSLRAISLLRHDSFDVTTACRRTGLTEPDLLTVLNAAWLTGELQLVRTSSVSLPQGAGPPPAGVTVSLLARIRNRLAGV